MKIIDGGGKKFKLPKLQPLAGRELFTKGAGISGLLEAPVSRRLQFFSFIQVHILDDIWVPLSTEAMLDNHVPKQSQNALLIKFLEYNCPQALELLGAPSMLGLVWDTATELFKEVIEDVFV